MQDITTIPALESIHHTSLEAVTGGCHKRRCASSSSSSVSNSYNTTNNYYVSQPPAPVCPPCAPPPVDPGPPSVSTSVSYS